VVSGAAAMSPEAAKASAVAGSAKAPASARYEIAERAAFAAFATI
jgi:hypothetical protein